MENINGGVNELELRCTHGHQGKLDLSKSDKSRTLENGDGTRYSTYSSRQYVMSEL